MSDPDKPERCLLVDAQPVGSVSADHVARAIRTMRSTPPVTHLAVGAVQMAQMLAALNEPPPPHLANWIEVPPPTVREGRAHEWKRQTRADRKKMRQRRRGDRAGRPL